MRRFHVLATVLSSAMAGITPAAAFQDIVGHVTSLTPTFTANASIVFKMDSGNTLCPVGFQLNWVPGLSDAQATYANLLAALLSRKQIHFVVNESLTPKCTGQIVNILAD
jgi:hypothetical protein